MHLLNQTFYLFYQKNYREIIDYAQELYDDGNKIINLSPHLVIPKGDFFNKESSAFLDNLIQPNANSLNHYTNNKHSPYLKSIDKKKSDIPSFVSSFADLTLAEEDEIIIFPGYDIQVTTIAHKKKVILKTVSSTDKNTFQFDDYRYLINSRTKWIILDHDAHFYQNLNPDFLHQISEYLLDFPRIIVIDISRNCVIDKKNNISHIEPRLTFRNIIVDLQKINNVNIYIPKVLLEFLYFFKLDTLPIDPTIIEINIKTTCNLLSEKKYQINQHHGMLFINKQHVSSYNHSPISSDIEAICNILKTKDILVDDGAIYGMQDFIALGLMHEPTLFNEHLERLFQ